MARAQLTSEQRLEIKRKAASGSSAESLAREFKCSVPTIYYTIRKNSRQSAVSAVAALQAEISADENRLSRLLKAISDAELLRDEIEAKKNILQSLKKLESRKERH
jgi:hypothetical protein